MNGHYVHFLIAEEKARTLGDACERVLPKIQRDFGSEITAKEVYTRVNSHRESLDLVERFRDEFRTKSGGLYDLELFKCAGNYHVTPDSEAGLKIINMRLEKIEQELRANGMNPESCHYFPDAIYELYKSAKMIGEQTEMELEKK